MVDPVIRGTGITVQTVLEFLGDSVEEILEEYPSLTREDIFGLHPVFIAADGESFSDGNFSLKGFLLDENLSYRLRFPVALLTKELVKNLSSDVPKPHMNHPGRRIGNRNAIRKIGVFGHDH